MKFSLHELDHGVETPEGNRVVYDVARGDAWFGAGRVEEGALVWELGGDGVGAKLSADVELDPATEWLMRCDRVEFPPGAVAHRHTHPGPGIRCLLFGSLTIDAEGRSTTYGPFDAWFEDAGYPVLATASESEETAFVRVMLLPREWEGKRTIRYVDPADEDKPRLQRATIYLEQPIDL